MIVSLECNQIFRISLGIMEDNENGRLIHVVHEAVVLLNRDGALGWWYDHALFSERVISGQYTTEVHALLLLGIWRRVGAPCRVAGIDSKVCAIAIISS